MAKKYTQDHEWIETSGGIGTVGISDYAQQQLGDVVFVELPEIGKHAEKNGQIAVVESVKAASEIYAPVSGTVTAVNEELVKEPQLVNTAAEGRGWFFRMKLDDPAEIDGLMDAAAYADFVAGKTVR